MKSDLQIAVEDFTARGLPAKLHLGCGPNILDGWINVEGEYCRGQENIVIHNIDEQYPLYSDTVDEILSVHVIEHIMPDKVPYMLKEWHRVLKPTGHVAIEWPDLLKMAQFITANPESLYTDNKKIAKRSVAGIFGNIGRYKDVAMLHKWGYSADSMIHVLLANGFSRAEVQPNQYRKTEMDSRVVGFK